MSGPTPAPILDLDRLDLDKGDGLVPVVAQHFATGDVLMLGYGSRESLERTLESGLLTFHSRSRGALWTKGETSGNVLRIVALVPDCDGDALLALVDPAGPTCHTGERSCFGIPPVLAELADTIRDRQATGDGYTGRLLADRNLRLKKLGEEATELAVACADGDEERVAEEAADLLYHLMVACAAGGVGVEKVLEELASRRGGGA